MQPTVQLAECAQVAAESGHLSEVIYLELEPEAVENERFSLPVQLQALFGQSYVGYGCTFVMEDSC